jgi:hypothetical protein
MNRSRSLRKIDGLLKKRLFVGFLVRDMLVPFLFLFMATLGFISMIGAAIAIMIFVVITSFGKFFLDKVASLYKRAVNVNRELRGDYRLSKNVGNWNPLRGESTKLPPAS